jgi:MFS transporter, FSR family, fosmidomycin resistance protein
MHSDENRQFNLKALLILSLGHLVTDVYQGALPAILPFLKARLDLSYSTAGIILLASNFTSSVVQPLFGYFSDKKVKPFLLPAGCLSAGVCFSMLPLSSNYAVILVLVVISGLGVAAFHPEGFKTAHRFTGRRQAAGMSVFSVGGNLGFALGPILALSIITHIGFSWLSAMVLLSLLFIAVLPLLWKDLDITKTAVKEQARDLTEAGGLSASLIILIGTVILRSWTHAGLTSYIPFYYIDYLKGDPVYAGKLVSFFLLGGVAGTVLGAPVADRWGHKKYLVFSMFLASVLLPVVLMMKGFVLMIGMVVFGMVLISTFTVTIVMAQRLLPGNVGVASGLMVGFAIGTGGIGVTVLGFIADSFGVPFALNSIAVLPVLGFFLSLFIKYREPRSAGPA